MMRGTYWGFALGLCIVWVAGRIWPLQVIPRSDPAIHQTLQLYHTEVQQMRHAMEQLVGKLVDLTMENRQLTAYIFKHDPELRLAWETKQEREAAEERLKQWIEAEFVRQ